MNFANRIKSIRGNTFVLLFSTLVISLLCGSSFAQKPLVNVKGNWKMNVETSAGSGSPTFDLKHENDSIVTGTYKGQLGAADVKGKVKGKSVHLEFSVSGNLVEYDGAVDGESMKGTVKLGSMGSGTFTGTRAKQ